MSHSYRVPAAPAEVVEVIRRSRFVTRAGHAASREDAARFIEEVRQALPGATHYCWAFNAGAPGSTTHIGMSDAGEPHGTAGRPMLTTLLHSGVGEVVAVCARFYGGVKLGTGGPGARLLGRSQTRPGRVSDRGKGRTHPRPRHRKLRGVTAGGPLPRRTGRNRHRKGFRCGRALPCVGSRAPSRPSGHGDRGRHEWTWPGRTIGGATRATGLLRPPGTLCSVTAVFFPGWSADRPAGLNRLLPVSPSA